MTTSSTGTSAADLTGDYTLDPAHTRLGFVARHAMVTKVHGQFHDIEGTAHLEGGDPSKSTATVTVKATSIDTGNEQRDGHLRSNDFFAMDEHPEITFTSTAVEKVDDSTYRVTGDLAIRGVTKPVTIDFELTGVATDPFGNVRVGFEGSATINRKDWGVNWNAPLEAGGVLVGEKIKLEIDVSAIKTPA